MDRTSVADFKKWFHAYVNAFASDDTELQRNFDLKERHTLRVCAEACRIGRALGLSEDLLNIAEVTALFHDIGRFEQFARYRTFLDSKSVNHAEMGVAVLRGRKVLGRLEADCRKLILRVIANHNKAALPPCEDERVLFFSRLLRDADKLDIWRVVTHYYEKRAEGERNHAIELDLPDISDISPQVCQDLKSRRIVQATAIKTLNDFKLLQVGWVYDLNFVPALERLVEKGYLDMIRTTLPDTAAVREVFTALEAYLHERLPGYQKRAIAG